MIHLPSLAQLDGAAQTRIWLCTAPTDMRRGFDRPDGRVWRVLRVGGAEIAGHRLAVDAQHPGDAPLRPAPRS